MVWKLRSVTCFLSTSAFLIPELQRCTLLAPMLILPYNVTSGLEEFGADPGVQAILRLIRVIDYKLNNL